MQKLFYYRGNYSQFKHMLGQKRREQLKDFEKQEKAIKEMKAANKSKKAAEAEMKNKQVCISIESSKKYVLKNTEFPSNNRYKTIYSI